MNVRLHIERIVLDGLPIAAGDEARFRAALELELTRRVREHGLAAETLQGGAIASLPTQPMSIAANAGAPQLGHGVAAAIHRSIGATPEVRR